MALSNFALTTVATLESELNIAAASATTLCELYIHVASRAIATYLGRTLDKGTAVAEYYAGSGTEFLTLRRPPLVSITSIAYDGTTLDSDTYAIHDADAGILYRSAGWIKALPSTGDVSGTVAHDLGERRYLVTYAGGWITPAMAGTRDLPHDLEMACIMTASSLYRNRGRDRAIVSETVGSASVDYDSGVNSGAIPDAAMPLLAPYRALVHA